MSEPTKIYRFPEGFASSYIVLLKNNKIISLLPHASSTHSLLDVLVNVRGNAWIEQRLDASYDWQRLAQACVNGHHEQYLVWTAKKGEINTVPEQSKCSCDIRTLSAFGCSCGAFKKEMEAKHKVMEDRQ